MSLFPESEEALRRAWSGIDSESGRKEFLDRVCAGDPALRARLESRLSNSPAPGPESAQNQTIVDGGDAGPAAGGAPDSVSGVRIGRYKLLEKIGEGGWGVVYVAGQTEPVRRRVALKVIKPGMDSRQVVARFETERQALAMMDHPNIAKVLDAGSTPEGRPFFVMELVRGIRITDYCEQNDLGTRDRLDLFIKVCHAIQHAHQKGIIHRDIKPSNILVTLNDGTPVPKVIDFGIAKATETRLTDVTVYTQLHQFLGTPAYMSPEQAEMSALDIDTRSDIYSLGVLLYELLTGATPFDSKELLSGGLEGMSRAIREKEPTRPSTRLMQTLARSGGAQTGADGPAADDLQATARRQSRLSERIPLIRGDLDWIVMKCLEKDRTRRYETVNGLVMDIRRHLANEPVTARPPSAMYRIQKAVRRNRLAFASGAAVLTALVLGLAVAITQYAAKNRAWQRALLAEQKEGELRKQAEAEARRANTESARSQQVAQFLKEMLSGAGPAAARGRDATLLREILQKTSERMEVGLKDQPGVECDLLQIIGSVYQDLGDFRKAEAMFRRSLALALQVYGNGQARVADAQFGLAAALRRQWLVPEAEKLMREVLSTRTKIFGMEHPQVAEALSGLAALLSDQEYYVEAETMQREALSMTVKQFGEQDETTIKGLAQLAVLLTLQDKLGEAEETERRVLSGMRRIYGEDHPSIPRALQQLAEILEKRGRTQEAEKILRECLALRRKLLLPGHMDVAQTLLSLSGRMESEGRLKEARTLLDEAIPEFERASNPSAAAQVYSTRGQVLARMGRWNEAISDLVRSIQLEPRDERPRHALAPILVHTGKTDQFREYRAAALALLENAMDPDPQVAERIGRDALLLPVTGAELKTAGRLADVAAAATNHWARIFFEHVKGLAEFRRGEFASALKWEEGVLREYGRQPHRDAQALLIMAMSQMGLGNKMGAEESLRRAVDIIQSLSPLNRADDLGPAWEGWLVCQALLTESEKVISGGKR